MEYGRVVRGRVRQRAPWERKTMEVVEKGLDGRAEEEGEGGGVTSTAVEGTEAEVEGKVWRRVGGCDDVTDGRDVG